MKKLPSGASLEIFESIDSTSLEVKRRIEKGECGPKWILALTQTHGYGRRGRTWSQGAGDFSGSLLLKPQIDEQLGQLSFVAALAVASTLDEVIKPERLTLKWPNDLLLDGGKVAGILLERVDHQGEPFLVIGIGINLVSEPAEASYPTARVMTYASTAPSPQKLLVAIDRHFKAYNDEWIANGFNRIRSLWIERAQGIGEEIRVRLPNEELTGVFDGLDETGGLILRSSAGKRIISAGEVYFGAAP